MLKSGSAVVVLAAGLAALGEAAFTSMGVARGDPRPLCCRVGLAHGDPQGGEAVSLFI